VKIREFCYGTQLEIQDEVCRSSALDRASGDFRTNIGGSNMPDKMNNPDQEKNLGGRAGSQGSEGGQYGGGQQSPARNPQDDQSTGQRGGRRGQNEFEDEDLGSEHGRQGSQNIGGGQSSKDGMNR